jgi:hypothetical protein
LIENEKEDLWYTTTEIQQIKQERDALVQRANYSHSMAYHANDDDDNELHIRGFENMIGDETVRHALRRRVVQSRNAVLDEQSRQLAAQHLDPNQLSWVYQTSSMNSVEAAHQWGQSDERQVIELERGELQPCTPGTTSGNLIPCSINKP